MAVLTRWIAPLNRERLEMLACAEAAAGNESLALEGVVHAFVAPVVRRRLGGWGTWRGFGGAW